MNKASIIELEKWFLEPNTRNIYNQPKESCAESLSKILDYLRIKYLLEKGQAKKQIKKRE